MGARCFDRLIMVALSSDGMDRLAIEEVDHGDDLEGHFAMGIEWAHESGS